MAEYQGADCGVMISLIAAVARNGVIGRQGGLPWRLRDDMAFFKDVTMGKPVVMGRKTFESIPAKFRPLDGRRNLVVTRDKGWKADGVEVFTTLEDALHAAGDSEVMVAGGGEVYAQAIALAGKLYLTEIDGEVEGDVKFPLIDKLAWREVGREKHKEEEWNYDWVTYERV